MPNVSAALFVAKVLDKTEVEGKLVLDVGARDYNGSVASLIKHFKPAAYTGVDIAEGPGVDIVCPAEELLKTFGREKFDVLICVEMLEHAENWREAVNNMKSVLKPGGLLAITTRSLGYPCHGFPHDFWRYEASDFKEIFADFEIINLESDSTEPGIFMFAKKSGGNKNCTLDDIALYSIPLNQCVKTLPPDYRASQYYRKLKLKQNVKWLASAIFLGAGKFVSRALNIK